MHGTLADPADASGSLSEPVHPSPPRRRGQRGCIFYLRPADDGQLLHSQNDSRALVADQFFGGNEKLCLRGHGVDPAVSRSVVWICILKRPQDIYAVVIQTGVYTGRSR